MKALVAFLGVLIVLGTALVIGVVIHRIYAGAATPSMTTAGEVPPVALAAGEHVAGIAAAGGDVAVWVNRPGRRPGAPGEPGDRRRYGGADRGEVTGPGHRLDCRCGPSDNSLQKTTTSAERF